MQRHSGETVTEKRATERRREEKRRTENQKEKLRKSKEWAASSVVRMKMCKGQRQRVDWRASGRNKRAFSDERTRKSCVFHFSVINCGAFPPAAASPIAKMLAETVSLAPLALRSLHSLRATVFAHTSEARARSAALPTQTLHLWYQRRRCPACALALSPLRSHSGRTDGIRLLRRPLISQRPGRNGESFNFQRNSHKFTNKKFIFAQR